MHFTKMHGLGNDFVVIDGINQTISLTPDQLKRLADRQWGVGCDQILLVEASTSPEAEFVYRIFNADGSEVEHCGNGARCFARFVVEQGLTTNRIIPVQTSGGLIELQLHDDYQVTVAMGVPEFLPSNIPFTPENEAGILVDYPLSVNQQTIRVATLAIGNPHAVYRVDDIANAPVAELGPGIEQHEQFPQRVNAGFVQVLNRQAIAVRVYERGAGETQACGTGACAAMVACRRWGLIDEHVTVHLTGGDLQVQWATEGSNVMMTGPTASVFTGEIDVGSLS